MELKYYKLVELTTEDTRSNRTFMELKLINNLKFI